jgi:hypothetical protein
MKLAGQSVTILITDEGEEVLRLVGVSLPDPGLLLVAVEESEDLGLWIRLRRTEGTHIFLLRWEYVLGIDFASPLGKVIGLKG